MNPNADHLKNLSPTQRQQLDQGLHLFKQNWTATLMDETLDQMPANHPLRGASAVEMTRIDLSQRWKQGQRITLEEYLESYPELGTVHTLSVDLIRHEYKVRKANGDPPEIEEYWGRFPTQYEEFQQRTLYANEQNRRNPKGDSEPERPARAKPRSPVAAAFGPAVPPSPVAAAFGPAAPVVVVVNTPTPAGTAPKPRSRWSWIVGAPLLLLLTAFLGWMGYKGGFNDPKKFFADLLGTRAGSASAQAGDQVQSLTVKLDVGAGEAVPEPIYLDLGLGFPFWLVSGGTPPPVPFGAVPQKSTASGKLPANSSATFTFNLTGDPGQDVLATTPQLLAGVKVGDIRRVGFASLAQQDWELAGFELQVNGQTLHSAKGLKVHPKQLRDEAMKKLGTLNQQGAPAAKELAELRDVVQFGLASDAQKARLKELEQQTSTAGASPEEKTRLERQISGISPWYVEAIPSASVKVAAAAGPRSPFDLLTPRAYALEATPAPRNVKVTVLTASHTNADTRNYVYVTIGGRKYLIGTPQSPLTNAAPQAFGLDLMAGPLDSSDLRGWGLGMLAPPVLRGKGPDRWHPRRLQVEVDGKTVFDSEDDPNDRQTLDAIRLVPPSQLDLDGSVVKNPSNSRELYLWQAGKASGFDPATGQMNPVPPGTLTKNGTITGVDPNVIAPMDPGSSTDPKNPVDPSKQPLIPDDVLNPKIPMDSNTPPVVTPPNLLLPPGLVPPALDPAGPGLTPPDSPPNLNPNNGFPGEAPNMVNPFSPGTPPPPVDPPPPQTIFTGPIIIQLPSLDLGKLLGLLPQPPNPPPAQPVGIPLQIGPVEFADLSRIGGSGPFTIRVKWTITGDESLVDHYDVILVGLVNDLSNLSNVAGIPQRNGQSFLSLGSIPKGAPPEVIRTDLTGNGFLLDGADPAWRFVMPIVTAIAADGTPIPGKQAEGPARSTASFQTTFVNVDATVTNPPQTILGPSLTGTTTTFKMFTAHDAFVPENPAVVVPLDNLNPNSRLSLTFSSLTPGAMPPAKIRFYTGFSGGNAAGLTMKYRVDAFANEAPTVPNGATTTISLNDVADGNVSVEAPNDPSLPTVKINPLDGLFTLNGSDRSMHAVTVAIPPAQITRLSNGSTWTITIEVTISVNDSTGNFTGDPAKPPVVFDATLLNQ